MALSDAEIVTRVRAGEVEAYRYLVERHYGDCLRYAWRALGNEADAEEAVQDAFARAYRFLHRYDEGKRFRGWLFGILLNRCRTIGAMRQRRDAGLVSLDSIDTADGASLGTLHPDLDGFDAEVQRALMRIEPLHREALLLKYADDWTYEEIAHATGARVSALKMRVKRARAQLLGLLRGGDDDE